MISLVAHRSHRWQMATLIFWFLVVVVVVMVVVVVVRVTLDHMLLPFLPLTSLPEVTRRYAADLVEYF